MENAKIENSNATYWGDFQKLWNVPKLQKDHCTIHIRFCSFSMPFCVFAVMFCAKIDEVSSCNEDTVFENHRKCLIQIASEASYVYILSWQRFIRNAKNVAFWRIFENATFWVIFKQCASKIAVTNMLETSVESSMDGSGKMHL